MNLKKAIAGLFFIGFAVCGGISGISAPLSAASASVASEDADLIESGVCGDDIKYTLNENGELVISGSGEWYDQQSPFAGDDRIKFVTINNGISSISPSLFSGCTSIASVSIPDSVVSIGENAFYYCAFLDAVTIPKSVEFIGNGAFSNCSSLKSLTIVEGGNVAIGGEAFYNCTSLASVELPDNVSKIGDNSFANCSNLKSISIPDSVTEIGNSAFTRTALDSITIPGSVESIGENVFYGCSNLLNATLENGVEHIGVSAFEGCYRLKIITLPDTLKLVGDRAFYNCSALTSVTIPEGVSKINDYVFYNCYNLYSAALQNGIESIGVSAFEGCDSLNLITFPDTLEVIGDRAFYNCSALTSVTIPGSVSDINDHAFGHCTKLKSITIENGVANIGSYTFDSCENLTSISIPNSIQVIGKDAFNGTIWLNAKRTVNPLVIVNHLLIDTRNFTADELVIPDSVTRICSGAFNGCKSLASVTIPKSVKYIDDYAFSGCGALTSMTIENPDCCICDSENTFNISESANVYAYRDSTLYEHYKKYYGFSFENLGYYPVQLMGDVNGDGKFDVADCVAAQRWLLGCTDVEINEWRAANYIKDCELDAYDLCLLKKNLIGHTELEYDGYEITVINSETGESIKDTRVKIYSTIDDGIRTYRKEYSVDLAESDPIRFSYGEYADSVKNGSAIYSIRFDSRFRSHDDTRDYIVEDIITSSGEKKISIYVKEEVIEPWKTSLCVYSGYAYGPESYADYCYLYDIDQHLSSYDLKLDGSLSYFISHRNIHVPSNNKRESIDPKIEKIITDLLARTSELEQCEITEATSVPSSNGVPYGGIITLYYSDENGKSKSLDLYDNTYGWGQGSQIDDPMVDELINLIIGKYLLMPWWI